MPNLLEFGLATPSPHVSKVVCLKDRQWLQDRQSVQDMATAVCVVIHTSLSLQSTVFCESCHEFVSLVFCESCHERSLMPIRQRMV